MADVVDDKQIRAEQIRDIIMQKLSESGEKDNLKDVLRDRLINSGKLRTSIVLDNLLFFSTMTARILNLRYSLISAVPFIEYFSCTNINLLQTGWRDELKDFCKDIIRKKGLEQITVEELVSEITPYGRAQIPPEIKGELLKRIKFFLQTA
jgi:Transcription factor e(y)2